MSTQEKAAPIDPQLRKAVSERLGPRVEEKIYADALRMQEKAAPPQTHTPGPWTISQQKGLSLFIVGGDQAIAEVLRANFNKETFANADLIAAAPELLEALEADPTILQQVADYLFQAGDGPMVDRLRVLQEVQEAAIAKARGRQL